MTKAAATMSNSILRAALVGIALLVGIDQAWAQSTGPRSYTFTSIDVPDASFTFALGINDRGQIVGSHEDPDPNGFSKGFLFSRGRFVSMDVEEADGINNHGDTVGWDIDSNVFFHGVLNSEGVSAAIDVPGATFTVAYGINDRGDVVGVFNEFDLDGLQNRGFVANDGGFTTIEVPEAFYTLATGINNRRQIVGVFSEENGAIVHGYLYRRGHFTTIDFPGASVTVVTGINDLGQIVGWTPGGKSFLYSNGVFTPIEMPGLHPNGINNHGQIVGYYTDARGRTHGFVLTPNHRR
jgi:probable HAF family extracellular repeat protein